MSGRGDKISVIFYFLHMSTFDFYRGHTVIRNKDIFLVTHLSSGQRCALWVLSAEGAVELNADKMVGAQVATPHQDSLPRTHQLPAFQEAPHTMDQT